MIVDSLSVNLFHEHELREIRGQAPCFEHKMKKALVLHPRSTVSSLMQQQKQLVLTKTKQNEKPSFEWVSTSKILLPPGDEIPSRPLSRNGLWLIPVMMCQVAPALSCQRCSPTQQLSHPQSYSFILPESFEIFYLNPLTDPWSFQATVISTTVHIMLGTLLAFSK